ncbi:MAG: molecular chaperone HtpG [Opitutales bacterium]
MSTSTPEKHTFQAETRQLLDIVINSLYTDKEIFIRELVSNASDSLEKLRHIALTEQVHDDNLPLEINITTDDTAGTITIQDYGIGFTREELNENIGTIAHSGSKAFAAALQEAGKGGSDAATLIGQFGVGFYSAFMVADSVKVYTRSWKDSGESLVWTSDGHGEYTIEETPDTQRRGAKIVVKLKEDQKEFASASRVEEILKRYSAFVSFPINVNGKKLETVEALWLRSKGEIKPEEYTEFYKFQANAFDEPTYTLHFSADAPITINALLFAPKENFERFGFGRMDPAVALYCKKVLIDPKPEGLLPEWMRFAKGVIDSADLPLNISRESMQDSALVKKIGNVITGRFTKHLIDEAKKDPEKYDEFYKTFGNFIKEGVTSDPGQKERLAKLLRYESSLTDKGKTTSLADYVSRMPEEQKEIYYLFAPSRSAMESGPYLETFRSNNREVLFLYEPIDEFVMNHLHEFEGKKLVAADSAELDLEETTGEGEALPTEAMDKLTSWLEETLGNKVTEVAASKRLVGSPAAALNSDKMMTPSMRRLMKAMQQDVPAAQAVRLEINPRHPLIRHLSTLTTKDAELAKGFAEQIYDNAMVAAGFIEDPREMINRVYQMMERLAAKEAEQA